MANQSEDVPFLANQEQERKYLQFGLRDLSRDSCFPPLAPITRFSIDVWQHFNFEQCMTGFYAASYLLCDLLLR